MICPGTGRDGTIEGTIRDRSRPVQRLVCSERCGRNWSVIGNDLQVPWHTCPDRKERG